MGEMSQGSVCLNGKGDRRPCSCSTMSIRDLGETRVMNKFHENGSPSVLVLQHLKSKHGISRGHYFFLRVTDNSTMALRAASSTPLLQIAQHGLFRSQVGPSIIQRYSETLLRPFAITLPWALSDIWESVLRAVPKKKTTHNKKRHRQMAGKALQDVTALNSCSGCGRVKRAHTICVYCIFGTLTCSVRQKRY